MGAQRENRSSSRRRGQGVLFADELARLDAERVVAVNAAAYFSRPGPRLTDGVELLAQILHPLQVSNAAAPGQALVVS